MPCQPERRDRFRRYRDALVQYECVTGADVLAPAVDPLDAWTIETTIPGRYAGVPPRVQRFAADRGLAVYSVDQQALHTIAVLTPSRRG